MYALLAALRALFTCPSGAVLNLMEHRHPPHTHTALNSRQAQTCGGSGGAGAPALLDGVREVYEVFRYTPATKEAHCYSWMFAEVLGPFACAGSVAHVAAGGAPLRMMEIGFHRGDSAVSGVHLDLNQNELRLRLTNTTGIQKVHEAMAAGRVYAWARVARSQGMDRACGTQTSGCGVCMWFSAAMLHFGLGRHDLSEWARHGVPTEGV